jgi:hypothetical protein
MRNSRRSATAKAVYRPIRGGTGLSREDDAATGNGAAKVFKSWVAMASALVTALKFRKLTPVPVCAGAAAQRPVRVVDVIRNRLSQNPCWKVVISSLPRFKMSTYRLRPKIIKLQRYYILDKTIYSRTLKTSSNIGRDKSFVDDLNKELGFDVGYKAA